ncbi:hypothetical protein Tco_0873824 [Tanacetum coccineum]|uniref:Uncharacterized protein n=1 Tax=Tanacetum coccineum TaxID=301880 RepID=A0ABQ5BMT7_9ASTR
MGDENPIRTLGDYSKPSHGGYRNTIKLPVGNNVKDPETLLLVGRGFLATANAVIDCRMAKIAVGEGITRSEIAKDAEIKFDKGTITLRFGKSKISFHRIPNSPGMTEKGVKNDIEPIAPTMTVNRLVLEWEEKIKLHLEREMEFNQWRSKNFKGKHPTLITTKGGMDDEGEVT